MGAFVSRWLLKTFDEGLMFYCGWWSKQVGAFCVAWQKRVALLVMGHSMEGRGRDEWVQYGVSMIWFLTIVKQV